ncbi:MAG: PEF-CTERM sorting domain-containing protein [Euryarchaeota archaeon]|nr:PEF-CTERM sorting domain-containing protein [Euryarchaeota archaeon]
MNGRRAMLISLLVVFAFVASMSAVSAYSITNGDVSYDPVNDETMWTFDVSCADSDPNDISHWTVAWCNEMAVKSVSVGTVMIPKDPDKTTDGWSWDYMDNSSHPQWTGFKGIKIDYQVDKGTTVTVTIILAGNYGAPGDVAYTIKASDKIVASDTVNGPVVCNEIPEFSTIAIPVVAILGLLFFFNHRKRRESK